MQTLIEMLPKIIIQVIIIAGATVIFLIIGSVLFVIGILIYKVVKYFITKICLKYNEEIKKLKKE